MATTSAWQTRRRPCTHAALTSSTTTSREAAPGGPLSVQASIAAREITRADIWTISEMNHLPVGARFGRRSVVRGPVIAGSTGRSRGTCCSRSRRPVPPRARAAGRRVTPPPAAANARPIGRQLTRHSSPVLNEPKKNVSDRVGTRARSLAERNPVGAIVGVNQRWGMIGFGPSRFVSEAGAVADPHERGRSPAVVPASHDPIELVVALGPVLRLPQVLRHRIERQAEGIPDAGGPHARPERVAGRCRSVRRQPKDLAPRRRTVLRVLRLGRVADRHVQHAVGPEEQSPTAVLMQRTRRARVDDAHLCGSLPIPRSPARI